MSLCLALGFFLVGLTWWSHDQGPGQKYQSPRPERENTSTQSLSKVSDPTRRGHSDENFFRKDKYSGACRTLSQMLGFQEPLEEYTLCGIWNRNTAMKSRGTLSHGS